MVLSTDLERDDAIPYFLWDDPMTVGELRSALASASEPERDRLLGRVLREARDPDVWRFTTPEEVVCRWSGLRVHLGRRRAFWEYLFGRWREAGLLRALHDAASELGGSVESVRVSPTFRRRLIRRGDESVIVDLARDVAPQGAAGKVRRGSVLVDSAQEILANKLCTLLARAEVRDLVDVLFLERAGLSVESALPLAESKDGAVSPGQLAWVLSSLRIGDDARIPGGIPVTTLREFVADLERRLARLAHPDRG